MNSKYNKLIKNTAVFAAGEFATKVLNYLIVPLYTYVLTTEEYGRIDLFSTTVSLFIPIITLMIQEALIRFLLGKEIEEGTAVSNCWFIYICGLFPTVLLFPGYQLLFQDKILSFLFCGICVFSSFNSIFSHYLKAVGKNVLFTVKGIISTVVTLCCNVLFLVVFRLGLYGFLYAMLAAQFAGVIFLLTAGGLFQKLNFQKLDFNVLKAMVHFSIPLIPNSLMWWIMSGGDKYIINWYLGDSANGLYSLALKIPTVISMFYSLFFQAWQMSAIEENTSEQRKRFYEVVYKTTNALLFFLIVLITMGVNMAFKIMSQSFYPSWVYVPILCLATALSCQSSFLGVVYTTSKRTDKAFYTTALGAILNLAFNFLLIRPLGLHGVALGTLIGYAVVVLIRARDAKLEIQMSFDGKRTIVAFVAISLQIIVTILFKHIFIYVAGISVLFLLVFLYKDESIIIVDKIRRKIKNV